MGIREAMNRNRVVSTVVGIVLIVLTIVLLNWNLRSEGPGQVSSRAFFTVDDGQTLFIDNVRRIPPFDHEGKPAYRAYVYTCDGGKTQWVAFLERYTPAAKQRLENPGQAAGPMSLMGSGRQLKKPGAAEWIDGGDVQQLAKVLNVNCPDGKLPVLVNPP
jgi:hypothetical protein